MCGIFAVVNDRNDQAANTVLGGLKKLEYRGYDSWGIAYIDDKDKTVAIYKRIGKISKVYKRFPQSKISIGHTRWATHGGVTNANAHPHLDCQKKIAVIHNGIVENYQFLKEELIQKKHLFSSETDSEIIAHLIEEETKTKSAFKAVLKSFKQLNGLNAIVVLAKKENSIFACKNGSPLVAGIYKNSYYLASDVTALLNINLKIKIYFLNDNEAVSLNFKGIRFFNLSGKPIDKKPTRIKLQLKDIHKSGYRHFLIKEISEQPKIISQLRKKDNNSLVEIANKINDGFKPVAIGCGSASYCGLAASYFFAKVGISCPAYGAYEYLPFAKFFQEKSLVFVISQSGETADTLEAVKYARRNKAYIVGIVNASGSSLERVADKIIRVNAGPEIAVVSTKAFTAQLTTLYLISQFIKGSADLTFINQAGDKLNQWLTKAKKRAFALAEKLMNKEHIFVLGKHLSYAAALEFALKIKEASYLHAEAFSSGELKHGVISLIQKGTLGIVLAANDEVRNEVLSSAAEIKARGAKVFGVATQSAKEFDEYINIPDLGDLTILGQVIFGQLLGYALAIARGTDPDKPRNLAKSVTVK